MPRRRKDDPNWKPSIPDPKLFQLPHMVSRVPVSIRTPENSDGSAWPALPSPKQTASAVQRQRDRPVKLIEPAVNGQRSHNVEGESRTSQGPPTVTDSPIGPSTRPQSPPSVKSMTWRPDVFSQEFVPRAYLEVNNAPAISIVSTGVDRINYTLYFLKFASPLFLLPLKVSEQLPSVTGLPLLPVDLLEPQDYKRHFLDSILMDLQAQRPEVRSYDQFGVRLECVDRNHQMYKLHVPGLRENAPRVVYGDSILLRHLLTEPGTNLPRGVDEWLSRGGRERGEPCPGFTGYEITATVHAIDKKVEYLYLRVDGVGSLSILCNVSFVAQMSRVHCLQNSISDIANELEMSVVSQRDYNMVGEPMGHAFQDGKTQWLRRMLFPWLSDGIRQTGLPSGTFKQEWYDEDLNYEQMKAVSAIQARNYGSVCYIINGPPGTGKTKTIVEAVTQLAKDTDFSGSILICAPSSAAADTLALRLRALFAPHAMFRLNEFSRTFAEVPQELLPHCYIENNIFSLPPFKDLMSYRIVVATCQSTEMLVKARLTNRDLASLIQNAVSTIHPTVQAPQSVNLHWSALFVDEAAQATEPEVLIPLSVITPKTGTRYHPEPIFVMAGDQYQLGPRVYDRTTTLHVSLLERLSERPIYASHVSARRNRSRKDRQSNMLHPPFIDLVRNYRSHPAILAVPSSIFYSHTLVPESTHTDSLLSWAGWRGRGWPVLFSCNGGVDDCEDVRTTGGGWYNSREANQAINYAQDLLGSQPLTAVEICIMSPFRSSVNMLRQIARSRGLWELNIGPMDAFQGLESRVVIICTTRARSRFLPEDALRGVGTINEPKKTNVALTRAKEGLIVIGNPWVLSLDPHWMAFLRFCWRNGLWNPDNEPRDPRMPEGEEGDVGKWAPPSVHDGNEAAIVSEDTVEGLEAALIYRDVEPQNPGVRDSVRRFMGRSQDDEMWLSGVEAMEALRVNEEYVDEEDYEGEEDSKLVATSS